MTTDTNNYDKHILDYIQFNEEQHRWYEEIQAERAARKKQWIEDYVKNFPFELRTEM